MVWRGRWISSSPDPTKVTEAGQPRSPHPLGHECVYTGHVGSLQVNSFTSIRVEATVAVQLPPSPPRAEDKEAHIRRRPAQGPPVTLLGAGTGAQDSWLWSASSSAAPLGEAALGITVGARRIVGTGAFPCLSHHKEKPVCPARLLGVTAQAQHSSQRRSPGPLHPEKSGAWPSPLGLGQAGPGTLHAGRGCHHRQGWLSRKHTHPPRDCPPQTWVSSVLELTLWGSGSTGKSSPSAPGDAKDRTRGLRWVKTQPKAEA